MTDCTIDNLNKKTGNTGIICDKYGNKFKYDKSTNSWITQGYLPNVAIVSETNNGLITPDILTKLNKVRQVLGTNPSQLPLKINPGTDAYWYYFKSSDKCIRFKVEGESDLRIEVDSGRLYRLLANSHCRGNKGKRGKTGKKGPSGVPGPSENLYNPTIIDKKLNFAIYTPTPLLDSSVVDLPNNHVPDISVRIHSLTAVKTTVSQATAQKSTVKSSNRIDQLKHLAISLNQFKKLALDFQKSRSVLVDNALGAAKKSALPDISLSDVLILPVGITTSTNPIVTVLIDPIGIKSPRIINNSNYQIDNAATLATIKFDKLTNIVSGSIILSSSTWDDQICVKSRQCGPDGPPGDSGEPAITIVTNELDNTNIIATCPIINVRLDQNDNTIYSTCAPITDTICVNSVKLARSGGILSNGDAFTARFASVVPTIDSCKKIGSYVTILPEDIEVPSKKLQVDSVEELDLTLYHWKPLSGCVTKRHFNRHNFNWLKIVNTEACGDKNKWYDSELNPRSGKYPHAIQRGASPASDPCVQEDFFYCPNIQLGGCGSQAVAPQ